MDTFLFCLTLSISELLKRVGTKQTYNILSGLRFNANYYIKFIVYRHWLRSKYAWSWHLHELQV